MAAATATEHIHDEVRELIRRRGIDPVTDHRSTRLLIDEVVAHYEERVPVSSLPPLLDRGGAMRHVFDSLAFHARIALHVRVLYGRDPHHVCEAQYKAVARALRAAVEPDPRVRGVPSTKGVL